ncbi:hypothetical protein VTN00DRAFT_6470 [Thermoascus crustaceus]|uniref:uncharacterized protein n=1 Tax=Thermoascus crustaceus TaxID=5088 RepID=UPI0037427698
MLSRSLLVVLSSTLAAMAMPQQTPSPSLLSSVSSTTSPPDSSITPAATLSCSDGSTIVHTTECTLGTPISYCYSPPPPIQCSSGYFPGVWHPGHCEEAQTCYPLDVSWLTTKCSNGGIPWSTSTLYEGTLAGGEMTTISMVSCSCAANQWYSDTLAPGGTAVETYCMPYSDCPSGMTASVSTNSYCLTAPSSACSDIPTTTNFCKCANPTETAVYPPGDGAVATGCT